MPSSFFFHLSSVSISDSEYQPTETLFFFRSTSVYVFSNVLTNSSWAGSMYIWSTLFYSTWRLWENLGCFTVTGSGSLLKPALWYFKAMAKWSPFFHCSWSQVGTWRRPPAFNSHKRRNFALSDALVFWSLVSWSYNKKNQPWEQKTIGDTSFFRLKNTSRC